MNEIFLKKSQPKTKFLTELKAIMKSKFFIVSQLIFQSIQKQ